MKNNGTETRQIAKSVQQNNLQNFLKGNVITSDKEENNINAKRIEVLKFPSLKALITKESANNNEREIIIIILRVNILFKNSRIVFLFNLKNGKETNKNKNVQANKPR